MTCEGCPARATHGTADPDAPSGQRVWCGDCAPDDATELPAVNVQRPGRGLPGIPGQRGVRR